VRREAEGERKLSLLALLALQSGAGGGAKGAHRLRLFGTHRRNKAHGQRLAKVATR